MKVLFLFDKDGDSRELSMLVKCCKILLYLLLYYRHRTRFYKSGIEKIRLKTCKLLVGVTYKMRTYLKCC